MTNVWLHLEEAGVQGQGCPLQSEQIGPFCCCYCESIIILAYNKSADASEHTVEIRLRTVAMQSLPNADTGS